MVDIVLEEQAHLLAAEVFADAPGICDTSETDLMCGLDNVVDVGEPEVHIEFCDGEDNGIAAMFLHFDKVFFRVFYIVETVITYCSVFDRHRFSPFE